MSPVYEQAYEHWDGDRTPRWRRFLAIAEEGVRAALRSRWVQILLGATLVHLAIRGGILYFTGQVDIPQGGIPPQVQEQISFTTTFLLEALMLQSRIVLVLMLALVAAPSLSRDLQAGAMSFYFSKPITRTEYALGKLTAPILTGLLVTALPLLVLWLLGIAFTPEVLYPDGVWLLPVRLLAASVLICSAASLIVTALSGLTRSTNVAAALWVGLALLSAGAARLITEITGVQDWLLADIFQTFRYAAETLLGTASLTDPTGGAWLLTLAWSGLGIGGIAWVLADQEGT